MLAATQRYAASNVVAALANTWNADGFRAGTVQPKFRLKRDK